MQIIKTGSPKKIQKWLPKKKKLKKTNKGEYIFLFFFVCLFVFFFFIHFQKEKKFCFQTKTCLFSIYFLNICDTHKQKNVHKSISLSAQNLQRGFLISWFKNFLFQFLPKSRF